MRLEPSLEPRPRRPVRCILSLLGCTLLVAACGDSPNSSEASPPLQAGAVLEDAAPGVPGTQLEPQPGTEASGPDPLRADPAPWMPPVTCGTGMPGPTFREGEAEAATGYAEELAAADLSTPADEIDFSKNNPLQRIVINYMLGTVGRTAVTGDEATAAGPLGTAVQLAARRGTPGKLDFATLRRGLAYFYPCSRPLPATLDVLKGRYGDYQTWPTFMVECSFAKNSSRRFFRAPELGVFIAETVEKDGRVRETEVIFSKLRGDGHLDFAVYLENGALSDRSTFASSKPEGITRSSPYFCVSCHMTPQTATVSTFFPTGVAGVCR